MKTKHTPTPFSTNTEFVVEMADHLKSVQESFKECLHALNCVCNSKQAPQPHCDCYACDAVNKATPVIERNAEVETQWRINIATAENKDQTITSLVAQVKELREALESASSEMSIAIAHISPNQPSIRTGLIDANDKARAALAKGAK